MANATRPRGSTGPVLAAAARARAATALAAYQRDTAPSTSIASSAASENQAIAHCPRGSTTRAASSGPIAPPVLPPTWNSDCAKPYRPPEAMRATRDDSGWNTAEPTPTSIAEATTIAKECAVESSNSPASVKPMPIGSE